MFILLINIMVSDGMKIYRIFILRKFKDDSVFIADGKRQKPTQLTFKFVGFQLWIKRVLPKNLFLFFRNIFDVTG
ncbi:hypothetical protein A3H03_03410 [Candidatus Kuenenbacteria bacterium RIFCSPLOWO2_12_FULL_42_13]|uniref:Uncharacterized protein n=1 Tax=Candidatus Kuenenbacteria bacterium RIFCSPLOWO2_12_FULL_42_13 TaxID=1798565 RepID=A0A1F6G2A5_9BACT|nr:MAG: hypothetical protein A3H03_03410 [Candidatus Kuenenbacteria bacterium RIFCSPLOWO2_12_FULL_42_13]